MCEKTWPGGRIRYTASPATVSARRMRSLLRSILSAVLCASLFSVAPAFGQAPSPGHQPPDRPDETMQHLMETLVRRHHGKVSLYARHLPSGRTVAIDPDVPVNTASVIKVAIMLEAMYQVKEGRVSLDDVLPLRKEDQVSGSGVLLLFRAPAQVNLETAIALMIAQSDNTATNLVLAHIGRDNVNRRLRALGFTLTTSIRPISRPKEGDQSPELKPFGIGRTTAREMAGILESIVNCDLDDQKLCARMVDMMQHQFWRNCIPHYLEDADTTEVASHIANKTGSLDHV